MDKIIEFEYGDNSSEVFTLVDSSHMNKTAEYSPELQEYIKALDSKEGKLYALVNALSAGEYFGSNRNGDYFPEGVLKKYHKTFEALGHVYKYHVNKDPKKSMGKVVFSHYNPRMKRVELILELDNEKASPVVKKLEGGELPSVSMGCRVPYDCCSVCGNKAKTLKQYCDHLKYRMNEVLPSGQKIYAINTMPKFFDLSVVTIPADRTAGFLTKVASVEETRVVPSAERAEMLKKEGNMVNTAELENTATIKKEVSAEIKNIESDPKLLIYNSQPRFDKEKLEKLSSYPLNDVLSTFLGLRIIPKKEDFQKLALYSLGKKDLADKLEKEGICFDIPSDTEATVPDDLSLDNFSEKIAGLLEEDVPYMSMTKQLVTARVLTKLAQGTDSNFNAFSKYPGAERGHDRSLLAKLLFSQKEEPKLTPHKNPIIPMGILGGLYMGYLKIAGQFAMSPSKSGFKAFLTTHPWLMPLMVGAGALGTIAFQDHLFTKTAGSVSKFLELSLFSVPASYTYSFMQENKARKGVPISEFQNFVKKHPFLSAMAATSGGVWGSNKLSKSFSKTAEAVYALNSGDLNAVYRDLIMSSINNKVEE